MSDLLDVEQVRAMATPAGALWAGERAPTALALARTALAWRGKGGGFVGEALAAEEARDLAIVERDEAYKQRDAAASQLMVTQTMLGETRADRDASQASGRKIDDEVRSVLGAFEAETTQGAAERAVAALAEARRERDEAQAKVAGLESMRAGVAYFACWPDGMLEALGATDVSGVADVMERVKALVGAERERDRLLRSEADACAILGAAPDELLSDAAKRAIRQRDAARDNLALIGKQQGWVMEALGWSADKPMGNFWEYAQRIRDMLNPPAGTSVLQAADWYRREVEALRDRVRAESEPPQPGPMSITNDHIRDIAIAMDRRKTWNGADPEGSWAGLLADLRVALAGRCAESEPPQVFRIQHEITIAGDLVTIRVAPLRDPAIRALPLGVQLGLVVCDG